MKTLQIGMGWFPEQSGGLNRYYYGCSRYLPKVGVDIQGLLTGSEQIAAITQQSIQAFAPTETSLLNRWQGIRQSVKQLASTEYDLVVAHFALYTFPILNQLGNLPLVFHFHGPWALESDVESQKALEAWVKKTLEQIVYRRASRFIVLSQAFKDILHQQYAVPLNKIHIIPGGVDLEQFQISSSRAEARIELNWEQERTILFCIRRLAKRMGLENLLEAIAIVKTQYPEVLLYIAGRGALAETLQTQITELKLTNHVRLLGYLPDEQLSVAYRAANFSVVPTISFEGFGLIIIESLATGTPVLGTPIGGIPEILQPFCPDLLFEDTSADKLAQGIIEVLSQKRQLPNSEACQAYARDNYAWSVIAPQIKSVYEQAC
ncbi:MAG TPA: glycosyltransferase family 4 protein [Coleofasciculaceae cyanobacterium]|jgi:glycosyltransferase involved in cell wall biosynthesis